MKEEDEIQRKCGSGNPFTVPEGYFDHLTQEVMGKLPEKKKSDIQEKKITIWDKVRPWLYMAAMFTGILLSIRLMINNSSEKDAFASSVEIESELPSDEYIQAIMDYSMMDDYTLYQYLTDADSNPANK